MGLLRTLIQKKIVLSGLLLGAQAWGDGWVPATVKPEGGALHRSASATSEVLGRYPAGTGVTVYVPARNGYHSLYFSTPWKGLHYVWISQDELELGSAVSAKSSKKNRVIAASDRNDSSSKDRSNKI